MPPRKSPEFSTILTPDSPARTREQIDVISRQIKEAHERDIGFDSIHEIKPVRVIMRKEGKKKPKRDTLHSTSQNHMISDYYIQEILKACIKDINLFSLVGQEELAHEKKKGIQTFLEAIFHSTEKSDLQKAETYLDACFHHDPHGNVSDRIDQFAQFVASHGSNNAVEGNASVNSGVGKRMDAPTDNQGKLLPAFEKMRNAFLDLGNIASKTPVGRDKHIHAMVIEAISPDLINHRTRASSLVYKEQRSLHSTEAPLSVGDYEKNFYKAKDVPVTTKLTDAQLRHVENGYNFLRSSTPNFLSRG